MKILLVTHLYPRDDLQKRTDVSFALHDFVKEWQKYAEVLVIRPKVYRLKYLIKSRSLLPATTVNLVDSAKVVSIPIADLFYIGRLRKYKVLSSSQDYFRAFVHMQKILSVLKEVDFFPDVVVGHMAYPNFVSYLTANKLTCPLVIGLHQTDFIQDRIGITSSIGSKIARRANGISCRSPNLQRKLFSKFPEVRNKQFTAISGVEERHFLDWSECLYKQLLWDRGEKLHISTVARLINSKKIHIILRSLKRLNSEFSNWRYSIIGDGPEFKKLQKLTVDLGLNDQVHFYGRLNHEKTVRMLQQSHIFVMVSKETLGLVYLEAMACGNIIIGRKETGVDGLIEDKNNGMLCGDGTEEQLYQVLNYLLKKCDHQKRAILLLKSYQTIKQMEKKELAKKYFSFIEKTTNKYRKNFGKTNGFHSRG